MTNKLLTRIIRIVFPICLFAISESKAQTTYLGDSIDVQISQTDVNEQLISHVIRIVNLSDTLFCGSVRLNTSQGVHPLSHDERNFAVAPHDSSFVSFKIVVEKQTAAGEKRIRYDFYDKNHKSLFHKETAFEIEQREQISLIADNTPILFQHAEDSIHVKAIVTNNGNTTQDITLVFNVPNLHGSKPFTERRETIAPGDQKEILFSFRPSGNLLSLGQFPVYLTAMKGKEKTIFGNQTYNIQNASSKKIYTNIDPNVGQLSGYGTEDNSLTLSYRQYNSSSNMLQARGGGYLNLPAGYLQLKGTIYKYNSQETPILTGTSLMYKLYENELTIGNVNETSEISLYGRGAKMMFSDEKKYKKLTFGAIDQNYNLLGSEPWFSNYYSYYIQGELGANNYKKGIKGTYIYQRNPYEKADYHFAGLQGRTYIGKEWSIDLKTFGSQNEYLTDGKKMLTGAAEISYHGDLASDLNLNGTAYYSSAYFPGNRRGTQSFTQGLSKKLGKKMQISGNISYSMVKPKYYTYSSSYESENRYGNLNLSFPRIRRLALSMYYQYQKENSSSYASFFDTNTGNVKMASNRMGIRWSWQSPNAQHSLYGTIEGGLYTNPGGSNQLKQAKTTLDYSFDWFRFNASYQKGAYYIYEYMLGKQKNTEYNRLTTSASINKNLSDKLSISSNLNFTKDVYQGGVPSANLNLLFRPKINYAFFANGYWYRYHFMNTNSNIYNIEVGVSVYFSKVQPSSAKKGTITAQLYYDNNSNNKYDKGDDPASNYTMNLSDKAFISDKEGKIKYSLIPYGDYTLKPLSSGSWFFKPKDITVNHSKIRVEIPLKQSGTLQGEIKYDFSKNSVEIIPRYEGIRFYISNEDKSVIQTIYSTADGKILAFLPVGEYTITMDKKTLLSNTDCLNYTRTFKVEAKKINKLDVFEIATKSRTVNIKRFTQ